MVLTARKTASGARAPGLPAVWLPVYSVCAPGAAHTLSPQVKEEGLLIFLVGLVLARLSLWREGLVLIIRIMGTFANYESPCPSAQRPPHQSFMVLGG